MQQVAREMTLPETAFLARRPDGFDLRWFTPLGGSQERERRAGTENVAGAVGLAAALRLACEGLPERVAHLLPLRDRLLEELPRRIPGTIVTGPSDRARRLANSASCCFDGIDSELLLLQLDLAGVATSSGSACTTGSLEPSHVLTAMGLPATTARGSLRLTPGRQNTAEEIETVLELLPGFVERLRAGATRPAARAR